LSRKRHLNRISKYGIVTLRIPLGLPYKTRPYKSHKATKLQIKKGAAVTLIIHKNQNRNLKRGFRKYPYQQAEELSKTHLVTTPGVANSCKLTQTSIEWQKKKTNR
jgi:hypothetical protein